MKILSSPMRSCSKGPEAWCTGTVWIEEIVTAAEPSKMKVNRVSFEPGARTAWHSHPLGQGFHVTAGVGWVQVRTFPAQRLQPGDSVWIEAGEEHWHGAAQGHTMVHMAFLEADEHGVDTGWLEHVTEEEYSGNAESLL
jgi:quercetin dioxygenase-like cupin family protein